MSVDGRKHPAGESPELCHYTRADTAFERILVPDGKLKMSAFNEMRDPLENQDPFVYPEFLDASEAEFERSLKAAYGALWRLRDNIRLLSLTQSAAWTEGPDRSEMYSKPWARPRMWEQYADNHAGVCLVFDKKRLLNGFSSLDDGEFRDGPVRYTPAGYAASAAAREFKLDGYDDASADARLANYVERHHDDFFLLKTGDWEAEHEYRVLLFSKKKLPDPYLVPYERALTRVILGAKFPAWQAAGVRQVLSHLSKRVDISQMSWHRGHPMTFRLPESATHRDLEEAATD